jgi:DNA-binding IclR family transcriptional regulator
MGSNEGRYTIASVARAIGLVDAFLQPPHHFALTELSNTTGQTKNQTFRMLQTLSDAGVVMMDPETKRYRLGYRVLEWGVMAQKGSPLAVAASPVMDRLVEQVGETIVLTSRTGDFYAICVDKRESSHALQISARVGRRVPLHCGAGSKCILAYSSPEFVERFLQDATPLPRYTDKTITEPDKLREEIQRIQERGYSISDEDLDPGACSIAAPINDQTGRVIAAISIASPKVRFTDEDIPARQRIIRESAQEISHQLVQYF